MAFSFPIFMLSGPSPSDRSLTSSTVGPVKYQFWISGLRVGILSGLPLG